MEQPFLFLPSPSSVSLSLKMCALRVVRTLLVSRRASPPSSSMTAATAAPVATATTTGRTRFNIVATVWSGEKLLERDLRFNFFSLTTPEDIATFQTVLEVLQQFVHKDRTIGMNDRTGQLKATVSDIQIKPLAAQLEARGITVKWHRLDGR